MLSRVHFNLHLEVRWENRMYQKLKLGLMLGLLFQVFAVCAASHHPQDFLKEVAGAKDEGEQIVQHYCANCHAKKPLISLGAPRMGHVHDWQPRIKQGIASLLNHTNEGINAMPPRGGCFECSDEQLLLAVLAMLPPEDAKLLIKDKKIIKKTDS